MRTQTLLLAALGLAGAATTMAQVYSVNAVGYVNTALTPGFNLISNPLDNKADNKLQDLFGTTPMTVYKFTGGKYVVSANDPDFGWDENGVLSLAPGEGAFIEMAKAATITFVGEVVQGPTKNQMKAGFNMVSSIVPQTGKLATDLKFPLTQSFTIYTYSGKYDVYAWDMDFAAWADDKEPTIAVGQAFWAELPAAMDWNRTFDVNNP